MGLARVVASSGNASTAAVLSIVYAYARMQSHASYIRDHRADGTTIAGGQTQTRRSVRSRLALSRLARQRFGFQMRDGSRLRCRILDSGALLSVHVDRDYDLPGFNWSAARTVVDIGAHVGTFTIWAALNSPNARVLAVEPNPETFDLLVQNIRENGLQDRVTAVRAAIGTIEGTAGLKFVEHSLGTRLARGGAGQVSVEVRTLTRLLADASIGAVDMLKIDCEGMEYDVLEALGPEGLRAVMALACEYHPEPGQDVSSLDRLLHSAGFRVQRPDALLGVIWATR